MADREPDEDGEVEVHADGLRREVTPDRPLVDPQMDELGYAPFAENIAAGLNLADASRGLVVGIYGCAGVQVRQRS